MLLVFKDSLYRNIGVLVSGTAIAQLLPVLLQPILKRLYTPADFGALDIYLKTLGLLFVVYSLKYDMAIILPKNKAKAILLLMLTVLFSMFFTIVCYVILFLFDDTIMAFLHFPTNYKFAIYILPLSTLFFSLSSSLNYMLIRGKRFKHSSFGKISRRGTEGGVQVGLAFVPTIKKYGLFIGDLLGNVIYSVLAYFYSIKTLKIDKRFFSIKLLKMVAKEYADLPKYNIIPELLNSAFLAIISFVVLTKFDIAEVGYMELTQRILAVPTAFVAISVGQVLLQRIAELINEGKRISGEIMKVIRFLLLFDIPFVIVIMFFAVPLFSFVFGSQWGISGEYARFLVWFYALGFLISPLGQVLIGLKKFKVNGIWKVGRFILVTPLIFIDFGGVKNYLLAYSLLGSLSYLLYLWVILYHAKEYDKMIKFDSGK